MALSSSDRCLRAALSRNNSSDAENDSESAIYSSLRNMWHPAMYSSDLRDVPRPTVLLGEQLVLARLGGEVRCFPDLCVHRGAALSLGRIEGDQLRCPYHGWTYGSDGMCTAIPARFGTVIPKRARLRSYQVTEEAGLIWVCLADRTHHRIPRFPEYDDPEFRVVQGPSYDWRASAPRRLENFVDFAHFAWVHDGLLASSSEPHVPDHDVFRDGWELRFGRRVREPVKGFTGVSGDPEALVDVEYDYFVTMPLTVHFSRRVEGSGQNYVLNMAASPVGPKHTRSFWFLARNYALEEDDADFIGFEAAVLEQDLRIVESQRPELLPDDLSAELHIRGVDRVSIEYRRWLLELAATADGGRRE